MNNFKLEEFEGPLDLLLGLIEEENLDITKISLSKVTDQYLLYIEQIENIRPVDLADFLVIASKLLYIKSKALMPYLIWGEEEEDGESLEDQLKLYKEFLEASKKIQKIINNKNFTFAREKTIKIEEVVFNPPKKLNQEKIAMIFGDVLAKLDPIFKLPKKLIEKTISLKEKIFQIRDLIAAQKVINFSYLKELSENKTEVIVVFLAILELVKQKEIYIQQDLLFEEIVITKIYTPSLS